MNSKDSLRAALEEYMTVIEKDGRSYRDYDHNMEVAFEAGWNAAFEAAKAEIARLTPRMVRELPTKAGWYWLKHELTIVKPFPVEVFDRSGVMCLREDGRYYRPLSEYAIALWSAEPIPMPVIEEEGER